MRNMLQKPSGPVAAAVVSPDSRWCAWWPALRREDGARGMMRPMAELPGAVWPGSMQDESGAVSETVYLRLQSRR